MSSRHSFTSSVLALALLAMSASVLASPRGGGGGRNAGPPALPQQRAERSEHHESDALSDSVRRIERSTRGQVLSAERVPYDGRDVNRIKTVDSHGRVRVYMDDPQAPPHPQIPDPPAD